jgi:hypothetical protein
MRKWDLTKNGMGSPYDFLSGVRLCPCPLLQGIITYEEIQRGFIDHAMIVALNTQQNSYVAPYPCEASLDGNNPYPNPPQAGMRFQLDPSVNIHSLGLNATGLIIAKALQDYGMIVVDQAGQSDFDIYLEELTFRNDRASWNSVSLPNLSAIPVNRLRVVESPVVADPSAVRVRTKKSADYYWRPFNNASFLRGTLQSGSLGTRLSEPVVIDGVTWWFIDYDPSSAHTYGWTRSDLLEILSGQAPSTPAPRNLRIN